MINRVVKCFKQVTRLVETGDKLADGSIASHRGHILVKEFDFEGILLEWGVISDGETTDSAGIVEKKDGSVELVYAGDIKFVSPSWIHVDQDRNWSMGLD